MWRTLAKLTLIVTVILGFSSCRTYQSAGWEPGVLYPMYHAEWLEVRDCIDSPIGQPPDGFQDRMELVEDLVYEAHQFPKDSSLLGNWTCPEDVETDGGVCIHLSIWLYDALHENGFSNVRLILGYRYRQSHAWVEWDSEEGKIILDPSFNFIAKPGFNTSHYNPDYCIYNGETFREYTGD